MYIVFSSFSSVLLASSFYQSYLSFLSAFLYHLISCLFSLFSIILVTNPYLFFLYPTCPDYTVPSRLRLLVSPFLSLPIVISKYLLSTRQTRQTPVLAGIHQRVHTIILATIDRPFLTPSSAHTATAVTPPTCVHPKTLSPPQNLDAPRHHSSPDPITPRSVAQFIPSPVIAPPSKSAPTSHPKLNTKKSEFASPSALTKPPSPLCWRLRHACCTLQARYSDFISVCLVFLFLRFFPLHVPPRVP